MSHKFLLTYRPIKFNKQGVFFLDEKIGEIEKIICPDYGDQPASVMGYVFRFYEHSPLIQYYTQCDLTNAIKNSFLVLPFSSMAVRKSGVAKNIWTSIERHVLSKKEENVWDTSLSTPIFDFLFREKELLSKGEKKAYVDCVWDYPRSDKNNISKIYYFGDLKDKRCHFTLHKNNYYRIAHFKVKEIAETLIFDLFEEQAEQRYKWKQMCFTNIEY